MTTAAAPTASSPTVGFVGLGNMGEPMVRRLAAAGHRIRAYDVAEQARARLTGTTGITLTKSPADVADDADVVILMLPDSDVVERVLLEDGLLDRVRSPTVVADMSSSEPARTQALARQAADRGIALVDAPVSGGVVGARAGSLMRVALGMRLCLSAARASRQGEGAGKIEGRSWKWRCCATP